MKSPPGLRNSHDLLCYDERVTDVLQDSHGKNEFERLGCERKRVTIAQNGCGRIRVVEPYPLEAGGFANVAVQARAAAEIQRERSRYERS